MIFMNTWEIDAAKERLVNHPTLGPATRTLANLRDAADRNSDGWAYWPKPARAAGRLMTLLMGDGTYAARERADATTAAEVRAAYRPIKAFRTRSGIDFEIEEIEEMKHRATYSVTRDPEGNFWTMTCSCGNFEESTSTRAIARQEFSGHQHSTVRSPKRATG